MDLISTLSKGLDVVDIAWEMKCREEDLAYRAIETERRLIDDARRAVNEKAEQLKAISGLSALIAGFAMVVHTNVAIPDSLDPILLCCMGTTTAAVVASMLIAMLNIFGGNGIPLFLVMLGLVAWVVFWRHPNRELGSSFVTAIAFFTLLFWVLHTKYKWDDLLSKGHLKLKLGGVPSSGTAGRLNGYTPRQEL